MSGALRRPVDRAELYPQLLEVPVTAKTPASKIPVTRAETADPIANPSMKLTTHLSFYYEPADLRTTSM